MADLNIVSDGAVLIRGGVIAEVGTSRRVENLETARSAREIDATGKVVMPAFVDPDVAIASPCRKHREGHAGETDIRHMSTRRLEGHAAAIAADLTRHGVLTVGAHTLLAPDLQNTHKALKLHQTMQSKPLRIRSVFAPPCTQGKVDAFPHGVSQAWLPAIFRNELSSLIEIAIVPGHIADARAVATAAAAIGFNIRFRLQEAPSAEVLELAYSAGATALLGYVPATSDLTRSLADVGCLNVSLAGDIISGDYISNRSAIDDGNPVAIGSGSHLNAGACLNPQFFLFLACRNLGMTSEEAIVATTYNAACSLHLSHVTGSLAPGKAADICVMDVDNYHELARRAGHNDASIVIRAGRIVYRRANPVLECNPYSD